ncbi:MAG TPA: LysR substrate-binding domain-containing protein [Thermoleophilaceae bacterium]
MELRHLRYFVAVAEELHFRRAAERLHVAQPAVSEQVRKLEQELGVQLLERTQRNVSLTSSGAAMLEEARSVLRQAEVARLAARNARDRESARLRIGYVASALPAMVPRALQNLSSATPQLETALETGLSQDLIEAVRNGRLDAAIVPMPAVADRLKITQLGDQRAVAALPIGHRDAVKGALSLRRLAPERILLLPRDENRPFYDAVVATCHASGLSPTLVELAGTHVEEALLAVASGAGMALLPESVSDRYAAPGVRFLPLDETELSFQTAAITRPDSTHLPTHGLLRALSRAQRPRLDSAPEPEPEPEPQPGVVAIA